MSTSRLLYFLSIGITMLLAVMVAGYILVLGMMRGLNTVNLQVLLVPWGADIHPELSSNPLSMLLWLSLLLVYGSFILAVIGNLLEALFSRKHVLLNRETIVEALNDQLLNELRNETIAVIPAHNEEETIFEVVQKTLKYASKVIVVNDGSEDLTAKKARAAGAIVLENPRKMGLCYTMLRGLKAASQVECQYIVTLDADGQYLPEEIPHLIYPLYQGQAEVVLGSRLKGNVEYMPRVKKFGNWAFTKVLRKLSGIPISDGQTGFRAFKKEILKEIIPLHYVKHTYTQQQIIIMGIKGITVREVPITFLKRSHGSSRLISNPFQYAVNGWHVILISLMKNAPLRFFSMIGSVFLVLCLPLLLYLWYVYTMINELLVPSWLMTVLVLILLSGLSLIMFGMAVSSLSRDTIDY